jgi:hypothetical protein
MDFYFNKFDTNQLKTEEITEMTDTVFSFDLDDKK